MFHTGTYSTNQRTVCPSLLHLLLVLPLVLLVLLVLLFRFVSIRFFFLVVAGLVTLNT